MTIPVIAFFNNKGGVGKTSLVYHLTWMLSDLDHRIFAADLDPQANLSSAFIEDERLAEIWETSTSGNTVFGAIKPLLKGIGDIQSPPYLEHIADNIHLLVGDLELARFEDELSQTWPKALDKDERSFRVISAIWRLLQDGAEHMDAELILLDLGPNLGAINRAAMIASDYVVVPLAPDLFSLQGLRNLGPTLSEWRSGWKERLAKNPEPSLRLPEGNMLPLGYVIQQHSIRLDRPVKAYEQWIRRIPSAYAKYLNEGKPTDLTFDKDPNCLGSMKHFRSLIPLAQEARKPIFHLRPADGALGSHFTAAQDARKQFEDLAKAILRRREELDAAG